MSLGYQGPNVLDAEGMSRWRDQVVELDLSYCAVGDLAPLADCRRLKRLILCHNERLTATSPLPRIVGLETLWVNWCAIDNLAVFVERVAAAFPNIRFLSMLGNPACPNILNGGSLAQYNDYRQFVVSKLPGLLYLEDQPVTSMEREKAHVKYGGAVERIGLSKVLGKQKKSRSRKQAATKSQVVLVEPEHPFARKKELVIPGQSSNPEDEWTTDEEDIDYWAGYEPSVPRTVNVDI